MASILTEVYVSIDGKEYTKLDLNKSEAIPMKYVYKDLQDVSKIFSPYSLSFKIPATPKNSRAFGFFGDTEVLKININNKFSTKIYTDGIINLTGDILLLDISFSRGKAFEFSVSFNTNMLSLKDRIGDDLINNLPTNPVLVNWLPNTVYELVSSSMRSGTQPMEGVNADYFVPLISNTRIFQRKVNTLVPFLDNVAYSPNSNPSGSEVLKASELSPAITFKSIVDMIKIKYNLIIEMPLDTEWFYKQLYIYCNSEKSQSIEPVIFDIVNNFGNLFYYRSLNVGDVPNPVKYSIKGGVEDNLFTIRRSPGYDDHYEKELRFNVGLVGVVSTKGESTISADFFLELENGNLKYQISGEKGSDGNISIGYTIKDEDFVNDYFIFRIKIKPSSPIIWNFANANISYSFYDGKYGYNNRTVYADYIQESNNNNNSATMGGTKIDLYKSIPEMKVVDFLTSFIKMFNISVFDASPNDEKLFWLTPKDLEIKNREFSKKEVDYTPYVDATTLTKKASSDFNYYNFKHKTSKYKSNEDYLAARGVEFGQATYPKLKPTRDLKEFKVETNFSILEALPIDGMQDEFTSYGFINGAEILEGGEKRYKPNTTDLTIFFLNGLRNLDGDKRLGFQKTTTSNTLVTAALTSYIKTSPISNDGFSLGFGLIQQATQRSLYFDYYKKQTERLLNPNALSQAFKLTLPAKHLVLNFSQTTQGGANVSDGFKLQDEIIIGETRFSILDAVIDITTGNTQLNLLNF